MPLVGRFLQHLPSSKYITDMGAQAQPPHNPPSLDPKSQRHVHIWPWSPKPTTVPFPLCPGNHPVPNSTTKWSEGGLEPQRSSSTSFLPPSLPPTREAAPSPRSRESPAAPSLRKPRAEGRPRREAGENPHGQRADGGAHRPGARQ